MNSCPNGFRRARARACIDGLALLAFSVIFCFTGRSAWAADAQWTPEDQWAGYNKTYDGKRFSPLHQINRETIDTLTETCRVRVARYGAFQAGPVVVDGIMYLTTPSNTTAVDATTCAIKWNYEDYPSQAAPWPTNRGVAYLNGRVFRGTGDGRLIALDAGTGKLLWTDVIGDMAAGEFVSAAPLAWNGIVFEGIGGGDWGVKGRIMAFDASTGRQIWKFNLIPSGGELGADSWKSKKTREHGGGGTWSSFALDPVTGELFVPVGNPAPAFSPGDRPGANLFTDSLVVLDAHSGALRWWFQVGPHDGRDFDLSAPPMLYRDAREHRVVALAGKDGFLRVVDRETHTLVFKTPTTTIDTGEIQNPGPQERRLCPGVMGGTQWNGAAFQEETRTLFVGSIDYCMFEQSLHSDYKAGDIFFGGTVRVPHEDPTGWLVAIDSDTGRVRWRYHAGSPIVAGVTVTAGNLVFTGDNDGDFLVLDSTTGALLKKVPIGAPLAGGVVTYEHEGKQYIAFTSGNVSRGLPGATGRPTVVIMEVSDKSAQTTAAMSAAPDPDRGLIVFRQTCAYCHGADGSWVPGYPLKGLRARMTTDQIINWVLDPAPPMPQVFTKPLDEVDRRTLADLAAYLEQKF